jgi:inner membrane protein
MTWPTHTLFGISTLWLLAPMSPEMLQANMGVLAAAAALGALMPDLDASESKIKHLKIPNTQIKPFMLPALIVSRSDQHRGLMHSLAGLGMMPLFVLPMSFYTGWAVGMAFLLGYASHLVADSATKSGIRLLYPRTQRFHLLPMRWRITTGSFAEETLFVPLALCCVVLLLRSLLWT